MCNVNIHITSFMSYETTIIALARLFEDEMLNKELCDVDFDNAKSHIAHVFLRAMNMIDKLYKYADENRDQQRDITRCLADHIGYIFPFTGLVLEGKDETLNDECNMFFSTFLDHLMWYRQMAQVPKMYNSYDLDALVDLLQLDVCDKRRNSIIAQLQVIIDNPCNAAFHNLYNNRELYAPHLTKTWWNDERRKREHRIMELA